MTNEPTPIESDPAIIEVEHPEPAIIGSDTDTEAEHPVAEAIAEKVEDAKAEAEAEAEAE
jgi:hypothetical protein